MDYGGLIIVCQGSCIKYASNPTGSIVGRSFDTNLDKMLNGCYLSCFSVFKQLFTAYSIGCYTYYI